MELWKQRGYDKMRAPERKARLGYALDREEALGYVVASALHKRLLTPYEARSIGKRAGTLPIFEKLAGHKKRGTTGSPECIALLSEAAPLSFAPPKTKPRPPREAEPTPAPIQRRRWHRPCHHHRRHRLCHRRHRLRHRCCRHQVCRCSQQLLPAHRLTSSMPAIAAWRSGLRSATRRSRAFAAGLAATRTSATGIPRGRRACRPIHWSE